MFDSSAGDPVDVPQPRRCGFCGNGPGDVFRLIDGGLKDGPGATICDACVERFHDDIRAAGLTLCPVCLQRYPRSGVVQLSHLRAVCFACVLALSQQVVVPAATARTGATDPEQPADGLRCTFCLRPERDAGRLFAGPDVTICDRCVAVCNAHLANDAGASGRAPCPVCRRPVRAEELLELPERRSVCLDCAIVVTRSSAR